MPSSALQWRWVTWRLFHVHRLDLAILPAIGQWHAPASRHADSNNKHRITSNNSAAITRRTSDLSVYEAVLHPDEGVQQAQAVNSAKKDATTARRAPAINRPRNVVTVPQNNVARAAHANQSYGDHRRKVGNSCSAPGARAEARDELCNSGCCYKPLYRDFLTRARSTHVWPLWTLASRTPSGQSLCPQNAA